MREGFFAGLAGMFGKKEGGTGAADVTEVLPANRSAADRNLERQRAQGPAAGEVLEAGRGVEHEVAEDDVLEEEERKAA